MYASCLYECNGGHKNCHVWWKVKEISSLANLSSSIQTLAADIGIGHNLLSWMVGQGFDWVLLTTSSLIHFAKIQWNTIKPKKFRKHFVWYWVTVAPWSHRIKNGNFKKIKISTDPSYKEPLQLIFFMKKGKGVWIFKKNQTNFYPFGVRGEPTFDVEYTQVE